MAYQTRIMKRYTVKYYVLIKAILIFKAITPNWTKMKERNKKRKILQKRSLLWKLQDFRYDFKDIFQHLQNRITAV